MGCLRRPRGACPSAVRIGAIWRRLLSASASSTTLVIVACSPGSTSRRSPAMCQPYGAVDPNFNPFALDLDLGASATLGGRQEDGAAVVVAELGRREECGRCRRGRRRHRGCACDRRTCGRRSHRRRTLERAGWPNRDDAGSWRTWRRRRRSRRWALVSARSHAFRRNDELGRARVPCSGSLADHLTSRGARGIAKAPPHSRCEEPE